MTDSPRARGVAVVGNDWSALDGLVPDPVPLVSVIVPYYDQPAELGRTLRALERQTHPRFEVIVVDDGSPEAPVVPPHVRLLRMPDLGFRAAAARNLGAAHASGDVLCFLDADTSPEPGYLEALTRLPSLTSDAVTVGRRRHADLARAADAAPIEELGPQHELDEPGWLRDAYAASRDLLDADHRSYRFVISAVLACGRELFDETGGFDERFDRYGGEDWEWAHRAWMRGAVLAHVPSAVAWHDGPDLAGRVDPHELRRRKNHETLALFDLIGVPGSVGRGVRSAASDVVVDLPGTDPAAVLLCADVLLEAVPQARILVDDALESLAPGDDRIRPGTGAELLREAARVRVAVSSPFAVPRASREEFGRTLADALETVGVGDLGTVLLTEASGDVVLSIEAARASARRARRPEAHTFATVTRAAPVHPIDGEVDLEGHLAGWR
ncbi:glycosyltransferase family 2 protein [Cnuibacter sp. UC19_7]|uniref:glycosyltransferase family 2 protein n=1 Tax=Cnuibacter sp. UC19_7 TaxID=3350166 RepID=UPI00366F538B